MLGELVRGGSDGKATGGLDGAKDGSFEAREREIEAVDVGMRERVFGRVAIYCAGGDRGAAGVGETEDFRDLVETLTDGVVASGTDNLKVIVLGHVDDLGMAAGDDKGEKRERGESAGGRHARLSKFAVFVQPAVAGVRHLLLGRDLRTNMER